MGFDVTEVGIYAIDPRFGEILYSVIYFWGESDYIPPSLCKKYSRDFD